MNRKPTPACGTVHAYWRHKRLHEPVDQPCLDAWNTWRREAPTRGPRQIAPCGTDAAYNRHVKRREPACPACLEAHAERNRLDYQAATLAAAIFTNTGT